jgi:hypothetical protein
MMNLEILKKRADELEILFNNNKDQLNHLLGRWNEAKELYEAFKNANAAQIEDGVLSGLEKIKADEDAAKAASEGKDHAA